MTTVAGIEPKDPYKVWKIVTMKKKNEEKAREMLEAVAQQVQPILRRRKWRVPLLSEFYPKKANLLGMNYGGGGGSTQRILIRLRNPGDEGRFYDFNHTLGTMLHEMTHNVCGPHNAAFYKLMEELWTEVEELMDKGTKGSGQGFDAASVGRLGSHSYIPQHNPSAGRLRDVMLQAAEARAKKQGLMSATPQRLGGTTNTRLTPAQAAAGAAERRARDDATCPSGAAGTQNAGYDDDESEVVYLGEQPRVLPHMSAPSRSIHTESTSRLTATAAIAARAVTGSVKRQRVPTAVRLPPNFHGGIPGIPGPAGAATQGTTLGAQTEYPSLALGDPPASIRPLPIRAASASGPTPAIGTAAQSNSHPKAQPRTNAEQCPLVIDLTLDDQGDGVTVLPDPVGVRQRRVTNSIDITSIYPSTGRQPCSSQGSKNAQPWWCCLQCSLANTAVAPQCIACGKSRPLGCRNSPLVIGGAVIPASTPAATTASRGHHLSGMLVTEGVAVKDPGTWECKFCTLANSYTISRCEVCESWRYASGAQINGTS